MKKKDDGDCGVLLVRTLWVLTVTTLSILAIVFASIAFSNQAGSSNSSSDTLHLNGTWTIPGIGAPLNSTGANQQYYLDADTQDVWYKVPVLSSSASRQRRDVSSIETKPEFDVSELLDIDKQIEERRKQLAGQSSGRRPQTGGHSSGTVRPYSTSTQGVWVKVIDGKILAGDVIGTKLNNTVASVGGLPASYIAEGALLAHMANGTGNITLPSVWNFDSIGFPANASNLPRVRIRYISSSEIEIDDSQGGPAGFNVVGQLRVNGSNVGNVYGPVNTVVTPGNLAYFVNPSQLEAVTFVSINATTSTFRVDGTVQLDELIVYNQTLSQYIAGVLNSTQTNPNTTTVNGLIQAALSNFTVPPTPLNTTLVNELIQGALDNFTIPFPPPPGTNITLVNELIQIALANQTFPPGTNVTLVGELIQAAIANITFPTFETNVTLVQLLIDQAINAILPSLGTNVTLVNQLIQTAINNIVYPDTTNVTTVTLLIQAAIANITFPPNETNVTLVNQLIQQAIANIVFPDTTNITTIQLLINAAIANITFPPSVTNVTLVNLLIQQALDAIVPTLGTNVTLVQQLIDTSILNITFPPSITNVTLVNLLIQQALDAVIPTLGTNITLVQQLISQALNNISDPTNTTLVNILIQQAIANITFPPDITNVTLVQEIIQTALNNYDGTNVTLVQTLIFNAIANITFPPSVTNVTLVQFLIEQALNASKAELGTNVTLVNQLIQQAIANIVFPDTTNITTVTTLIQAAIANITFPPSVTNVTLVNLLIQQALDAVVPLLGTNVTLVQELIDVSILNITFPPSITNVTLVNLLIQQALDAVVPTLGTNITLVQQLISQALNNISDPTNTTLVNILIQQAIANITFPPDITNITLVQELIQTALNNYQGTNVTLVQSLIAAAIANITFPPSVTNVTLVQLLIEQALLDAQADLGTNVTLVNILIQQAIDQIVYPDTTNITTVLTLIQAAISNITFPPDETNVTLVQQLIVAAIANITFPPDNITLVQELITNAILSIQFPDTTNISVVLGLINSTLATYPFPTNATAVTAIVNAILATYNFPTNVSTVTAIVNSVLATYNFPTNTSTVTAIVNSILSTYNFPTNATVVNALIQTALTNANVSLFVRRPTTTPVQTIFSPQTRPLAVFSDTTGSQLDFTTQVGYNPSTQTFIVDGIISSSTIVSTIISRFNVITSLNALTNLTISSDSTSILFNNKILDSISRIIVGNITANTIDAISFRRNGVEIGGGNVSTATIAALTQIPVYCDVTGTRICATGVTIDNTNRVRAASFSSLSGATVITSATSAISFDTRAFTNVGSISASTGNPGNTYTTTGTWTSSRFTSGTNGNIRIFTPSASNAPFPYIAWNGGQQDPSNAIFRDNSGKTGFRMGSNHIGGNDEFTFDSFQTSFVSLLKLRHNSAIEALIGVLTPFVRPILSTLTIGNNIGEAFRLANPTVLNTNTGPYINLGNHFANSAGDRLGTKVKYSGDNNYGCGIGGARLYCVAPLAGGLSFHVSDTSGSPAILDITATGIVTPSLITNNIDTLFFEASQAHSNCFVAGITAGGWAGNIDINFWKIGKVVHFDISAGDQLTFSCATVTGCGPLGISTSAATACAAYMPLGTHAHLHNPAAGPALPATRVAFTNNGFLQIACTAGNCNVNNGYIWQQLVFDTGQSFGTYLTA